MFFEEIKKKFLFSEGVLPYKVTLLCGEGVIVEGQKGIVMLDEGEIRFRVAKDIISIVGEGLKIIDITANEACVTGKISFIKVGV